MTVRAKFYCSAENNRKWGLDDSHVTRSYDFTAVYEADVPDDQRYAKATPTGSLTMQVDNPAVRFEPGKYYYLDITEAN